VSEVDSISPVLTDGLVEGLQRSGLIHEEALLSELPRLDLARYRLVILATTPVLDAAQQRFVAASVAAAGRHVVLLGCCGWSDGADVGPQIAGEWTGVATSAREFDPPVLRLEIDGAAEDLRLRSRFAVPVFAPPAAEVVGRWGDGAVGAMRRDTTTATWWAFGLPPNRPGVLRALGRRAGCHVVNDADDTTLLGDGLLVVHSLAGGRRTLRLPGGPTVTPTLPPRSTTVFDAETGAVLLG
jgi:hypothetical protein